MLKGMFAIALVGIAGLPGAAIAQDMDLGDGSMSWVAKAASLATLNGAAIKNVGLIQPFVNDTGATISLGELCVDIPTRGAGGSFAHLGVFSVSNNAPMVLLWTRSLSTDVNLPSVCSTLASDGVQVEPSAFTGGELELDPGEKLALGFVTTGGSLSPKVTVVPLDALRQLGYDSSNMGEGAITGWVVSYPVTSGWTGQVAVGPWHGALPLMLLR